MAPNTTFGTCLKYDDPDALLRPGHGRLQHVLRVHVLLRGSHHLFKCLEVPRGLAGLNKKNQLNDVAHHGRAVAPTSGGFLPYLSNIDVVQLEFVVDVPHHGVVLLPSMCRHRVKINVELDGLNARPVESCTLTSSLTLSSLRKCCSLDKR